MKIEKHSKKQNVRMRGVPSHGLGQRTTITHCGLAAAWQAPDLLASSSFSVLSMSLDYESTDVCHPTV